MKILSLFSGIGAFEEALNNKKLPYQLINYCEFKERIAKAYSLIHNVDISKNLGDITKVNPKDIEDFDLMTYGFPCQDISALGKQKGFFDENGSLTRSGLFLEAMRIVQEKKPKFLIAENVRSLTYQNMKPNFDLMLDLLDTLGYNTYIKILNAKDFNLPHSRNRVFLVSIRKDIDNKTGFKFPEPQPLKIKASDLYDTVEAPDYLYLEERQYKAFNEFRLKKGYSTINKDILTCLTTKHGQKSNAQNFIHDEKGYRILSAGEFFAFQGFKKDYGDLLLNNGYSMNQIGYMCGNSIAVPVLEKLLEELYNQYILEK